MIYLPSVAEAFPKSSMPAVLRYRLVVDLGWGSSDSALTYLVLKEIDKKAAKKVTRKNEKTRLVTTGIKRKRRRLDSPLILIFNFADYTSEGLVLWVLIC